MYLKMVLAGMFAVMLVGCASQSEVNELRAEVESAKACCADNATTIERMYQKLMSK